TSQANANRAARDRPAQSIARLTNLGLGALIPFVGAQKGLRTIAPASAKFEEDLAASERHNKGLLASAKTAENARKRALGKPREAERVTNPQTGRVRGIPSRGLPYVRSQGFDTVESFINFLNSAEEDKEYFANRGNYALGGKMR